MQRRPMVSTVGFWLSLFLVIAFAVPGAQAKTTTFYGAGMWSLGSGWSNGVPVDGDTVVIWNGANVTNSWLNTANLISYTLSAGATQTFVGTNIFLYATNAYIYGTLTHTTNTTSAAVGGVWYPDSLLQIAASNVTVYAGGKIDVNGKGYQGNPGAAGYGPGGGNGVNYGAGGGYGGKGGDGYNAGSGGTNYGLASAPVDPGSGAKGHSSYPANTPGSGGGAVHIRATGLVTIDGSITANGTDGQVNYAGGGSGGGIYIECSTFQGSGLIWANGGNGTTGETGGGGGGGRIAIVYTNAATQAGLSKPSVVFSTRGGTGSTTLGNAYMGQYGTLYFPDAIAFPSTNLTGFFLLVIPSFTSWGPSSLTITNGLVVLTNGFSLTVTNQMLLDNGGGLVLSNHAALNCGSLVVTNGSSLYMYSGTTGGAPWSTYGSLISVTNNMVIASSATNFLYSEPTNGGSVYLTAANLIVGAGGMMSGDGNGYYGYNYPAVTDAYGPGHASTAANYGSAGYGGPGGKGTGNGGVTYGSAIAPVDPGSGGMGGGSSAGYGGGNGAAAIRIHSPGQVTVNGTISANGNGGFFAGGGGSGGSVYIDCDTFKGVGLVRAEGGDGAAGNGASGAGAGGGRIAVYYSPGNQAGVSPKPTVQFSTKNGFGAPASPRDNWHNGFGTLYLVDTNFFPTTNMIGAGKLVINGLTSWSGNSLTISNGPVQYPDGSQILVAGKIAMGTSGRLYSGTNSVVTCTGNLELGTNAVASIGEGSRLSCGGTVWDGTGTNAFLYMGGANSFGSTASTNWSVYVTNRASLYVSGDLIVTNQGQFLVFGAVTNTGLASDYGALVSVTGNVYVATNCAIYPVSHPTNGGSAWFQLNNNLQVAAGGTIDASGKGFQVNSAGGPYGPGRGTGPYGGGGYGGGGGVGYLGAAAGGTYGSSNAPIDPGSAAGANGAGAWGQGGGGAVRIQAVNQVAINGTINANGMLGGAGLTAYAGGSAAAFTFRARRSAAPE